MTTEQPGWLDMCFLKLPPGYMEADESMRISRFFYYLEAVKPALLPLTEKVIAAVTHILDVLPYNLTLNYVGVGVELTWVAMVLLHPNPPQYPDTLA